MDELTTNLKLMEAISASAAMNNARSMLEETAAYIEPEQWEAIRRYVLPLLQAEHDRLKGETTGSETNLDTLQRAVLFLPHFPRVYSPSFLTRGALFIEVRGR